MSPLFDGVLTSTWHHRKCALSLDLAITTLNLLKRHPFLIGVLAGEGIIDLKELA